MSGLSPSHSFSFSESGESSSPYSFMYPEGTPRTPKSRSPFSPMTISPRPESRATTKVIDLAQMISAMDSGEISTPLHRHTVTRVELTDPGQKEADEVDARARKLVNRIWRVYSQKIHSGCKVHRQDPKGFRGFLVDQLNAFNGQLLSSASLDLMPTHQFIQNFIQDLKNKSLKELCEKYYQGRELFKGTGEPFLNDLSDILNPGSPMMSGLLEEEANELSHEVERDQLPTKAVNRDKLMRLIHFLIKDDSFNHLFVVDINEVDAVLRHAKSIADQGNTFRFQLLVRSNVHYASVDIEMAGGKLRGAVMDSAGPPERESIDRLIRIIQGYDFSQVYLIGGKDAIQFDRENCAYFGLDSLKQSSQNPKFFDALESIAQPGEDGVYHVLWSDLPENFIENTTSTRFIHSYVQKRRGTLDSVEYKVGKTFMQFIHENTEEALINDQPRPMNKVIHKKIAHFTGIASNALRSLSPEMLSTIMTSDPLTQFVRSSSPPIPDDDE